MKFLGKYNELFGRTVIRPEGSIHLAQVPTVGNWQDNAVPGVDLWNIYIQANVPNVAARQTYYAMYEYSQGGSVSPSSPCVVWRQDGTSTGLIEQSVDGLSWAPMTTPAGTVQMRMSSQPIPAGWLGLDGQTLTNAATNYPALWATAPTLWRSGNDLDLPNMTQAFPMGSTAAASGIPTTGSNSFTLADNQVPIPSHKHATPNWTAYISTAISRAFTGWGPKIDIDASGSTWMMRTFGTTPANPVIASGNTSGAPSATTASDSSLTDVPTNWGAVLYSGSAAKAATQPVNNVPKSFTVQYIIKV